MKCNHQFIKIDTFMPRTRVVCALCAETRDLETNKYTVVTKESDEIERKEFMKLSESLIFSSELARTLYKQRK